MCPELVLGHSPTCPMMTPPLPTSAHTAGSSRVPVARKMLILDTVIIIIIIIMVNGHLNQVMGPIPFQMSMTNIRLTMTKGFQMSGSCSLLARLLSSQLIVSELFRYDFSSWER